jgi:hypothetical protein
VLQIPSSPILKTVTGQPTVMGTTVLEPTVDAIKKTVWWLSPYSFGLSATSQPYFSL